MDLESEFLKRNPDGCLNLFKTLSDSDKEKYFLFIRENKEINQFVLNELIENLPGDARVKYLDYYDFGISLSSKIIAGVSEETQFKIIKYFFDNMQDKVFILSLFEKCPKSFKEDFLRHILEYEKSTDSNVFNSFDLERIMDSFDYSQRLYILKELVLPYLSDRINGSIELQLLKCFGKSHANSDNYLLLEAFNVLEEFDKNKDKSLVNFYAKEVVKLFDLNGYDALTILKRIIERADGVNYLLIYELPEALDLDKRLPIVIYLCDYFLDNDKQLSSFTFLSLVYSLEEEDITKVLEKYIVTEKKVNYLKLFDNKYALKTLMYLIKMLPEEELKANMGNLLAHLTYKEEFLEYSEEYEPIIDYYSNLYNLNKDNLTVFIKKFGFISLKYISSNNLSTYINLPKEMFDKFLELFRDENLFFDENNRNDVLNSLIQRKFMLEHRDIYNIFSLFETFIRHGDYSNVDIFLRVIEKEIDVQKILLQNSITREELFDQIKSGNLEVLHKITDRFIAVKREQYTAKSTKPCLQLLNLDKIMTRSSYKKYVVNERAYLIHGALLNINDYDFTPEQCYIIDNPDLLERLIEFKKNPKEVELSLEDKKYLKYFSELLDIMYDKGVYVIKLHEEVDFKYSEYDFALVQKSIPKKSLLGIMLETNPDGLLSMLNNKELFEKLQTYLAKYKMLGWNDTYTELMTQCDITVDETTLGSILSNFDRLVEKIESKEDTLTATMDRANCYSSTSQRYSLLFGKEDYMFIAANAGRNKSPLLKHDRIKGDIELIPKMYQRTYITVPPVNTTFTLDNKKKLAVNIGNFTNMMNLTYGERTDACMRQGGAFDKLFKYCITNNNGFHVRITNPSTGKLVSRVSGFRNGNTVFLNELRTTLDKEYSNDDLCEVIKQVANYLVQNSKNSDMPIDNVFITCDYALEGERGKDIPLGLSKEEKEVAFRNVPVNYMNEGLLLASSDNGRFVPYHFTENVPEYPVLRDKVKVYKGQDAIDRIQQIKLINAVINGGQEALFSVEEETEVPEYVISGEDFYIAKYRERTDTFVMDFAKDREKTNQEISEIMDNLDAFLELKGSGRND